MNNPRQLRLSPANGRTHRIQQAAPGLAPNLRWQVGPGYLMDIFSDRQGNRSSLATEVAFAGLSAVKPAYASYMFVHVGGRGGFSPLGAISIASLNSY
jgi:hypothetical protein